MPEATGNPEGRILFFEGPCVRPGDDSCSRCQQACPAGAVSFGPDGLPEVDAGCCTACGICIGICDAFGSDEITAYDFAKRIERIAESHGASYLSCREDVFDGLDPAENVTALNCLASLSPELVAYLLASGTRLVLVHDLAYCDGCAIGGKVGGRLWQRSFEIAQEWTGRQVEAADEIPERASLADQLAAPDRRGLFTGVVAAAGDVASGRYRERKSTAVDDFLARRERMRATVRARGGASAYLDEESREAAREGMHSRRLLLAEALERHPEMKARMENPRG